MIENQESMIKTNIHRSWRGPHISLWLKKNWQKMTAWLSLIFKQSQTLKHQILETSFTISLQFHNFVCLFMDWQKAHVREKSFVMIAMGTPFQLPCLFEPGRKAYFLESRISSRLWQVSCLYWTKFGVLLFVKTHEFIITDSFRRLCLLLVTMVT